MAKQRTDKCTYQSRYAIDTWVTPAQYICEFICEKKAKKDKKELPHHFWRLKEWAQYFRSQTNTANKLLKKYDVKAIVAALKDKESWSTYSLRAPWLETLIKNHQIAIDLQKKKASFQDKGNRTIDVNTKPRKRRRGSGILDRLEELDESS